MRKRVIDCPLFCYTYTMAKVTKQKLNKDNQNKMRGEWLSLTAFFSLTIAGIVLSILCLANSRLVFIEKNYATCVGVTAFLLLIMCGVAVWLTLLDKKVAVKMIFSGYVFLLFCLALIFTFQKTGFFRLVETPEGIQSYLEEAGTWMSVLYILLQYLQVILLPIPSLVSTVAGVALFGAFKTMIFSLIGILLGSLTAFFIGRKLGYKAVAWMVGVETLEKWQKKLKGKDNLILTGMFILPLVPDDILCFIAGLSSMSNRYFLVMMTITRCIGISATCYSFDLIPWDTWWGVLIWLALFSALICTFILVYKHMDKIMYFLKKTRKNRKN